MLIPRQQQIIENIILVFGDVETFIKMRMRSKNKKSFYTLKSKFLKDPFLSKIEEELIKTKLWQMRNLKAEIILLKDE